MPTTQNAVVTIAYSDVPGFPADAAVDHITVTCAGSNPANSARAQAVPPSTATVTFASPRCSSVAGRGKENSTFTGFSLLGTLLASIGLIGAGIVLRRRERRS